MVVKSFEILQKKLKNKKILQKYKISKLGIFGSFARGQKARDIDFYIDADFYNLQKLPALKKDLEEIAELPVDIMVKKYANPIILYRAQKDMRYVG
jgi:predicted nucleotidyltransferase